MTEQSKKKSLKDRAYIWAQENANTHRARVLLFVWSVAESSFWPIPSDVVLIGMLASGARRWLYLSLFTAGASVLGGLLGYVIGFGFFDLFGERIVSLYNLQEEFMTVQTHFAENAFWAMFISAFTPIPYKVFTIAGGLFRINIVSFIVASILGRGLRFVIVGWVSKTYGEQTLKLVLKHFKIATFVALMTIAVLFFLL